MVSQRKGGALLGYVNILIKNVVNLIYTPMLLAFIGQDEFGVYQTAYQFIFTMQILSFGFSAAYIRFYTIHRTKNDEMGIRALNGMYLILYALICMLVILLGCLFANNCGILFSESFTATEIELTRNLMFIMTFNIAVILISTVFDAYIISHERFMFQQSRYIIATILTPFAVFLLLYFGLGAVGAAVGQLAVNVLLLALNAYFAVRKLKMRFVVRNFDKGLFISLIVFSSWIFVNQLTDIMTLNLPSVILGAISGASSVAVFAIATQLRGLFYTVSSTLPGVFVPMVNRMAALSDDNTGLSDLMIRVGRYQAILFCWILGGFILLGRWFVCSWAGDAFHDAYWLTLIMVIPLFVPLTQNLGIEIQKARNKHRTRSIVYFITASLNLLVTFIFSKDLGYWAAAIGYAAYIILATWAFMNWYYQRRIRLDMISFWKKASPPAIVCVVITAVCMAGTSVFPVDSFLSFVLWGVAYSILYGVMIWFTALDKVEKTRFLTRVLVTGRKK